MTRKRSTAFRVACLYSIGFIFGVQAAQTTTFTYDAAGRLIGADYGSGQVITYRYDARGNLLARNMAGINTNAAVDLSVSKVDDVDPVMAGSNLTYTITLQNAGPDAATGVVMTDVLPVWMLQVSASFSQGSISVISNSLSWNVGILAVGAQATLDYVVRPMAGGTVTNMVAVTANEPDGSAANNVAQQATTVIPAVDTDGDGIPDVWEYDHYGNATNAVAGADDDGDGETNLREYIADTDPLDATSVLKITGISNDATGRRTVTFASSPVRLYDLQFTPDLLIGLWTNVVTDAVGAGASTSLTDTNTTPRRIYRVKVRAP